VVLSYELFGLSIDETALAMSVPIGVVNNIRASEGYSQFKGDVLENIRKTTTDVVTKKFEESAEHAAKRVIDLVDSPSGIVSLSAAKQVLGLSHSQVSSLARTLTRLSLPLGLGSMATPSLPRQWASTPLTLQLVTLSHPSQAVLAPV
jgi:hypothetical protein